MIRCSILSACCKLLSIAVVMSVLQAQSSSSSSVREFDIVPSSGVLPAQSQLEVSVQLCSQTVRKYNVELHVDVDDVQPALLLLPITARSVMMLLEVDRQSTEFTLKRVISNYTAIIYFVVACLLLDFPTAKDLVDQPKSKSELTLNLFSGEQRFSIWNC